VPLKVDAPRGGGAGLGGPGGVSQRSAGGRRPGGGGSPSGSAESGAGGDEESDGGPAPLQSSQSAKQADGLPATAGAGYRRSISAPFGGRSPHADTASSGGGGGGGGDGRRPAGAAIPQAAS